MRTYVYLIVPLPQYWQEFTVHMYSEENSGKTIFTI